jgi:hypothetical protein
MATEIPAGIEFQHLMSHTFPGFLSAVSLFMLVDVWSPIDLSSFVIKDITGFVNFVGFILLIGTILGVIIDGIHHSIIEDAIFDRFQDVREPASIKSECILKCGGDASRLLDLGITHHYFFNKLKGEAINVSNFFIKGYYSYSEFYSNTFLSLIPFSLIVPFYLVKSFHMSWSLCVYIAIVLFIIGCFCLYSSYNAYKSYKKALYSAIYGYLEGVTGDAK